MAKPNMNKSIRKINSNGSVASRMIDSISNTNSTQRSSNLDALNKNLNATISHDGSQLSRNGEKGMNNFIHNMIEDEYVGSKGKSKKEKDMMSEVAKLFEMDSEKMYSAFQKHYGARNALYDDLNSITERIYELEEALFTTRDAIITPDEMTNTVSRSLRFSDGQSSSSELIKTVEGIEKKHKLLNKIKNQITVGALKYGIAYTYHVPHSFIYQDYQRRKNQNYRSSVAESVTFTDTEDNKILTEAATSISEMYDGVTVKEATVLLETCTEGISVINNPMVALESAGVEYMQVKLDKPNADTFMKQFKAQRGKSTEKAMADGVYASSKTEDFSDIRDCYLEIIDPRKILPVKIMDEVIGYYYVRRDPTNGMDTNRFGEQLRRINKGTGNYTEADIANTIVGKLADNIINSFDKKFLKDNEEFRDLILATLMYDENYKRQITFQFIPAEFMTEHMVNDGRSMLEPALFFGKLYLALLLFNMMLIIGRSSDQRVYYPKDSGVDTNLTNHVQRTIRSIKRGQMNFNDLMSYTSIVSRVGAARELFIPVGKTGEKGIEMDIIEGQRIDTHDELMDKLHRSAINATSVPSVIMNYINEADYAKTLVMANAKHLMRCVAYQTDLNESITDMYKKILLFDTELDEEVIDSFEFKFTTPSGLNAMNYADVVNNVEQVVNFIVKTKVGENGEPGEGDEIIKDKLTEQLSRKLMYYDWELVDELYEKANVEAQVILAKRKAEEETH